MKNSDFKNLIKDKGYQIFLFVCSASLPFNFAAHTWLVCAKDGQVSRWEVRFELNRENPKLGRHMHLNGLPAFSGIERINFLSKRFLWKARLIGQVEGGKGSLAHKMYDFIKNSDKNYPYRDKYNLLGPNSNTYVEWVLDHFPDYGLKLPLNSIGKGFKIK